jgi:hypothetical protein
MMRYRDARRPAPRSAKQTKPPQFGSSAHRAGRNGYGHSRVSRHNPRKYQRKPMSMSTTVRKPSADTAKNGKACRTARRGNGAHLGPATAKDAAPNHNKKKPSWFTSFAQNTAHLAGRPTTFMLATVVIIVWAVTGPLFGYSDTWQLVINTGTTIVTFLMVFLIQHTQNRDSFGVPGQTR